MGAVTPLGDSVDEYWKSLVKGKSGIGPMTLADPTEYPARSPARYRTSTPAKYINPREARRMARFSQTAVAAAALAFEDSGINLSSEDEERMGVVMGNGNGGFPTTEDNARTLFKRGGMKVSPYFIPMILPNMAAANVSRLFGLKGYTSTVITACAAGTQGIGEAAEAIRRGAADVVLGGGCEAGICQLGLGGFNVIKALSRSEVPPEKASRPFDANRDGFVPAEGAAILILESLEHALGRGAEILAEVSGYGVSSDAFHAVQPDEDGAGAARAMRWAIEDAGMQPSDIDYINAHGTSTPKNDMVETLAIKTVFGEGAYEVPISSTKSMIGHALGGAGALEAVACIKTIRDGIIHPTINYETADPDCDLDYVPNKARKAQINTVLSNSFGFGGQNACVVFRAFEEN
ncbi:3-oxoacyl-[acyl-carrier-protein] synthase 2 [Geodia barretti]|uniref:3-oxoacyl-[acyl-carrier-protein] synthase n=4 Tax=Geodia barretti TaxID=519541 RepID=A0AA35X8H5_GEOBA|nr:3-oxoacyl-[acyl-carrier-protein] synthase 2 [Geodia barretti]